jgi:hypothetical protein
MSNNDDSKKKEEEEKKNNLRKEQWIELSKVFNFLKSKGLRTKECFLDNKRVDYVEGNILEEKIKENLEELCIRINAIMKTNISSMNPEQSIQEIYTQFKSLEILSKACRKKGDNSKKIKNLISYENNILSCQCDCGQMHEKDKKYDHFKYMDLDKLFSFEPSYYYIINLYRDNTKIYNIIYVIIFFFILFCFMPIWPKKIKLVVWWISFAILILLLFVYSLKALVYLFFYILGYEAFLFPDIDDPNKGFFESLERIISVKRSTKYNYIVIRISLVILLSYIASIVYKNPGLIINIKKVIFNSLLDLYKKGIDEFVNSKK